MRPDSGAPQRDVSRVALGAALAAAVALAGCGGEATPGGSEPAAASPPASQRFFDPLWPLLVVDQDAGDPLPEGGRAGALFVLLPSDDQPSPPDVLRTASDARWLDPTDALMLPDESWLVLESKWAPGDGPARGALFHVTVTWDLSRIVPVPELHVDPEPWWTDPRSRQPVALARDAQGTLFVSDREADPLDLRAAEPGRRTGCVFGIEVGADGRPARTAVVAAGPELVTPGALLASGPRLLLLDADANPRGLLAPDGRPATPGVLFDLLALDDRDVLAARCLHLLLECETTTSPVALLERRPTLLREGLPFRPGPELSLLEQIRIAPEVYLVDANFDLAPGRLGDGALFRVDFYQKEFRDVPGLPARGIAARLHPMADGAQLGAHALVDPAYGCPLPDGRLAFADANADPLRLGSDDSGKGVYGTGRGAVFGWDPALPAVLELLAASEQFVTPVAVRLLPLPPDGDTR